MRSPSTKPPPPLDSHVIIGLGLAAIQAAAAMLSLPPDLKIPTFIATLFCVTCILFYVRGGKSSSLFLLSLSGSLLALGIFLAVPIQNAFDKTITVVKELLHPDLRADDPYYLTISVFEDENGNGVKDPTEHTLSHIKIKVRQHNWTSEGILDERGSSLIELPRSGKAMVIVCGVSSEKFIDASANSTARADSILIGIPPSLINSCEIP